jgi:hypothetical protein
MPKEKKILIVCSDENVQEAIRLYFQRVFPEFTCAPALDYEGACQKIIDDYFDLAFVESVEFGECPIDGIGIFKVIKLFYGPEARVIFMVENPNTFLSKARGRIVESKFLEEISNQFLLKPFDLNEFKTMVNKTIH